MLRKPFYASLAAVGLMSMMGIAGNAMAASSPIWVGSADYTQAPGGTAANAEQVGPFNEFDFSSAGVTLLKPGTVAGDYDGYYQSFVNQHLLDGVLAPGAKLNNSYELTVAASFHEQVSGTNPLDLQLTGGNFNLYFGPGVNRNFNADSGFTDGASILHGTIVAGSGALFSKPSGSASGYSELTIHVDSYDINVFDPATIASGDSIFTLRLNNSLDAGFLNPIASVMGHQYIAANGDLKVASDGNLILSVPEPETYALMLAGLGLVGFATRRKQSK